MKIIFREFVPILKSPPGFFLQKIRIIYAQQEEVEICINVVTIICPQTLRCDPSAFCPSQWSAGLLSSVCDVSSAVEECVRAEKGVGKDATERGGLSYTMNINFRWCWSELGSVEP